MSNLQSAHLVTEPINEKSSPTVYRDARLANRLWRAVSCVPADTDDELASQGAYYR